MMLEGRNQTVTQGNDALAVLVLRQSKFASIVRPPDEKQAALEVHIRPLESKQFRARILVTASSKTIVR